MICEVYIYDAFDAFLSTLSLKMILKLNQAQGPGAKNYVKSSYIKSLYISSLSFSLQEDPC